MSLPRQQYWFPAKRFGWGWGPPLCWQGWLVVALYCAAQLFGALVLLPGFGMAALLLLVTVSTALLIAICWVTGEPPRWRWGGPD